MNAKCTDAEFIELFKRLGAQATADHLQMNVRTVFKRRRNIENKIDAPIVNPQQNIASSVERYPGRTGYYIDTGIGFVGSDGHYYPDMISTAHRVMVKLAKELKPKFVDMNGDCFDLPTVSKHAPLGWQTQPTVQQEREWVDLCLSEIEDAAKGADLFWNLGNHDFRFEQRLAERVPEYAGTPGMSLQDHFPRWKMGLSHWINDEIVVKHRWKGGIHATHNNALWSGKTMITGHLHSLKVTPLSCYGETHDSWLSTRWGVDTGTMSDPVGDKFRYVEDNPLNWRSGFVVLTFHKGRLLWPEVVHVFDEGKAEFRGQIIEV